MVGTGWLLRGNEEDEAMGDVVMGAWLRGDWIAGRGGRWTGLGGWVGVGRCEGLGARDCAFCSRWLRLRFGLIGSVAA
jgi:hypothetical protein